MDIQDKLKTLSERDQRLFIEGAVAGIAFLKSELVKEMTTSRGTPRWGMKRLLPYVKGFRL